MTALRSGWWTGLALLILAATATRVAAAASAPAGWVVLGAEGVATVRVLTEAETCPDYAVDGVAAGHLMLRAAPNPTPGPGRAAAVFPSRVCEARLPAGARRVQVGEGEHALTLRASAGGARRIVVIGDTGCRLKTSDQVFQSCGDEAHWPLARIAKQAAALAPDLVVHVGDYHYRESPCPAGRADCAGSPWGYGEDTWRADLFTPMAPLLAAAPWIVVRGNHETCRRAGQGWFRFLDPAPFDPDRDCEQPSRDGRADYTAPYAVPLAGPARRAGQPGWQLIVFDSARAGGRALRADEPAYAAYLAGFDQVAALARRPGVHSLFLSHHPILGYALIPERPGEIVAGDATLQSVMQAREPQRLYPRGIVAALHGHVHTFEALGFASDHPATLVSGNSGSGLYPSAPTIDWHAIHPAPGANLADFANFNDFGFLVLDRDAQGSGWHVVERDGHGRPVWDCRLTLDAPGRLPCTQVSVSTK